MVQKLYIIRDPSNSDKYMATYKGEEAHNLAHNGTLADAIREALNVWGLDESEVYIEASN